MITVHYAIEDEGVRAFAGTILLADPASDQAVTDATDHLQQRIQADVAALVTKHRGRAHLEEGWIG